MKRKSRIKMGHSNTISDVIIVSNRKINKLCGSNYKMSNNPKNVHLCTERFKYNDLIKTNVYPFLIQIILSPKKERKRNQS